MADDMAEEEAQLPLGVHRMGDFRGSVEHAAASGTADSSRLPPTACVRPDGSFFVAYPAYEDDEEAEEEEEEEARDDLLFQFYVLLSKPPTDGRRRLARYSILFVCLALLQLLPAALCQLDAVLGGSSDAGPSCAMYALWTPVVGVAGMVALARESAVGLAATIGLAALAIAYYCLVFADTWALAVALLLLVQVLALWKARHALLPQWHGTVRAW